MPTKHAATPRGNAGRGRARSLDAKTVAVLENALTHSDPDFWSVVSKIELEQYQAMAKRHLATALPTLEKSYADLHRRVKSTRMWSSVYDTACLTLSSYEARANSKEKKAAQDLLRRLRQLAHPDAV